MENSNTQHQKSWRYLTYSVYVFECEQYQWNNIYTAKTKLCIHLLYYNLQEREREPRIFSLYLCPFYYPSVSSQLLQQEVSIVSLSLISQTHLLSMIPELQMHMKRPQRNQGSDVCLHWVDSSTSLFKTAVFVLRKNAFLVKYVNVCVYICMFFIYFFVLFLWKGQKKVTAAFLH